MKQLEVSILGQVYMLGCPEGGEALLRTAVASVDREMAAIRGAGKVKARERIAVLAALNLAYQSAERGALPPSAQAAPVAQTAGVAQPATGDVDINGLLQRVNAALADDDQLL